MYVYLNIVLYNVFLLLSCFMHDEIKVINTAGGGRFFHRDNSPDFNHRWGIA